MPPRRGSFKVILDGHGPITIREADHLHTGGEGVIYQVGNTVVKVYLDPDKMIRDGMAEKVKQLAALQHPYIVIPEGVVLDPQNHKPMGLYLPFVHGAHLPPIFTNTFRDRTKFGDKEAQLLTERMRETIEFTHAHNALMIDPNSANWRVDMKDIRQPEPRAIDVDSWTIGRWKTSATMPSIRDWHSNDFSNLTDWFSWGVITFELFTGVHPYKGTLAGYSKGDFESRMKDNASVFTPGMTFNHNVRDFSRIPSALLEWYAAEFQQGERSVPPSVYAKTTAVTQTARTVRVVTTASGSPTFERLLSNLPARAVRIWPCGAVLFDNGNVADLKSGRMIGRLASRNAEVVRVRDGWLFADFVSGNVQFSHIDERTLVVQALTLMLVGHTILRYEERLFMVTETELVELEVLYVGRPMLSIGKRTSVLQPKSTYWSGGVGIQDALGATFLVTPFGDSSCVSVRTPELDGLRPVAAKAGNRFAAVLAVDKNGDYRKLEFSFNRDYTFYTLWEGKTDNPDLNMAMLPRGVCVTIVRDGELVIFVPTNGQVNKVTDRTISTRMSLDNWEDRVAYLLDGQVWAVLMK
jgi:hypothetical protein